MRVISGKYKGRKILGFDIEGTRPTMDRVKESVFGIIQNNIKDSNVLDLFAGSGALGIEALSNGAKTCYFVDNNINVINTLNKNLVDIDNAFVMKSNYENALSRLKQDKLKFNIIFLDPPYKLNLVSDSIKKILEYDLIDKDGLIVCEYENENIECYLEIIKDKKYGDKKIRIYRY